MEEILKANNLLNMVKLRVLRIKTLEAYERAARIADPLVEVLDPKKLTDRQYSDIVLLNLQKKARLQDTTTVNNEVVKALVPRGQQQQDGLAKVKNWIMNSRSRGSRWRLLFQNFGYGLALLMSTAVAFTKIEKDLTVHEFNILIKTIHRVHPWLCSLGRSLTPVVDALFERRDIDHHFVLQDLTDVECDQVGYGIGLNYLLQHIEFRDQIKPTSEWVFHLH